MSRTPFQSSGPRPNNNRVSKPKARKPGLVFQPKTYGQFRAGANLLVNAIRPTFGPVPRTVAIEQAAGRSKPAELLDDGAVIARRIIQLPNRGEDMGAMYLRHTLWELRETVGDGTATAAILFQSLFNQGVRYVEDGGNAMVLRDQLENLLSMMIAHIESQSIHLAGSASLASLANTICHDLDLATMFGEIFDIIGEHGRLEIRSASGHTLERTYTEGMYWDGGLLSRTMLKDPNLKRVDFENAAILVTDLEISDPHELVPVLNNALVAGIDCLVIVAKSIPTAAIGMLQMKENREKIHTVVVKTPGADIYTQRNTIEDLTILTGAQPILGIAGGVLQNVTRKDFGNARRFWADFDFFGIVGGGGDSRALRHHVRTLRKGFVNATAPEDRTLLRERIGKLMGGAATLYIGDRSPIEQEARKEVAERTAAAMRSAIREGVVPGGGVTLLSCRNLLRTQIENSTKHEERAACRMLLAAVEAPIRTLMQNAGFEPVEWMLEINKAGIHHGLDTIGRKVVDMNEAGIYDSTSVVTNALAFATKSAALALTVDVLVHRTLPPKSYTTS